MFKDKETLEELKIINKKLDIIISLFKGIKMKEFTTKKGGNE